jgi:hypothetical protein
MSPFLSKFQFQKRGQTNALSEGRFLTTHVGSLPRSPRLLEMLT